ncbi:MAG TPA: dihydrolipoamide acetyltransferase family protein [Steroidobacteraceae bacterium]|nr:dihydrolipoamide acetyltransferase family protein [Steroidobacteraceae bacterium]
MSQFVFKMPDLGEGTVEAEIVAWHTKPGDVVQEDQVIVEVMTDKAAVEVPAPVGGRVVSISGEPGDKIAVGSPLIVFESAAPEPPATTSASLDQTAPTPSAPRTGSAKSAAPIVASAPPIPSAGPAAPSAPRSSGASIAAMHDRGAQDRGRVKASPANRRRAREAGIDLSTIEGSGPGGRILRSDLIAADGRAAARPPTGADAGTARVSAEPSGPASSGAMASGASPAPSDTTEIKVIGVRRVIAERMSEAKRTIPHFAYVEEVDVTELESLRQHLNSKLPKGEPGLTYLPLVVLALSRTLESFPQCNVRYDAARGVLVRHRAVHVGIATQTPEGLKVPVVRNAHALSLWDLAAEIRRVSERARSNAASRDELVGSTITVTSLGKLGGIASTPVINAPEVAIIGLNKAVDRPVVQGGAVIVRRIMNLSSSFDHRFVDGYDAAAMIQTLKDLLEHPATIFIPKVKTS